MKKVMIFDFDDTLVWSLPYWWNLFEEGSAKEYGVKLNPEFPKNRHGRSNLDTAKLFVEMHGIDITGEELLNRWHDKMEENYKTVIKPITGAYETLEYLKNKGYIMVLASATAKVLLNKAVDIFDMRKYFDFIICEEEVGKSKRHPDIFLKIFEMTNSNADECVCFEDSVVAIETAYNLGIDCFGIITELNKKNFEKISQNCVLTTKTYSIDLLKRLEL